MARAFDAYASSLGAHFEYRRTESPQLDASVPTATAHELVNAALACSLSYQEDPVTRLDELSPAGETKHSLHVVKPCGADVGGDNHFVVAANEARDTYWIAVRGTDTDSDVLADVEFAGTKFAQGLKGNVHQGFLGRANALPLDFVRALLGEGKRVVVCGHSLGGAVAVLYTLRLMFTFDLGDDVSGKDLPFRHMGRLACVTFGQPSVGDATFASSVHSYGYRRMFHCVTQRNDVVPLACSLAHALGTKLFDATKRSDLWGSFWNVAKDGGGAACAAAAGAAMAAASAAVPALVAAAPAVAAAAGKGGKALVGLVKSCVEKAGDSFVGLQLFGFGHLYVLDEQARGGRDILRCTVDETESAAVLRPPMVHDLQAKLAEYIEHHSLAGYVRQLFLFCKKKSVRDTRGDTVRPLAAAGADESKDSGGPGAATATVSLDVDVVGFPKAPGSEPCTGDAVKAFMRPTDVKVTTITVDDAQTTFIVQGRNMHWVHHVSSSATASPCTIARRIAPNPSGLGHLQCQLKDLAGNDNLVGATITLHAVTSRPRVRNDGETVKLVVPGEGGTEVRSSLAEGRDRIVVTDLRFFQFDPFRVVHKAIERAVLLAHALRTDAGHAAESARIATPGAGASAATARPAPPPVKSAQVEERMGESYDSLLDLLDALDVAAAGAPLHSLAKMRRDTREALGVNEALYSHPGADSKNDRAALRHERRRLANVLHDLVGQKHVAAHIAEAGVDECTHEFIEHVSAACRDPGTIGAIGAGDGSSGVTPPAPAATAAETTSDASPSGAVAGAGSGTGPRAPALRPHLAAAMEPEVRLFPAASPFLASSAFQRVLEAPEADVTTDALLRSRVLVAAVAGFIEDDRRLFTTGDADATGQSKSMKDKLTAGAAAGATVVAHVGGGALAVAGGVAMLAVSAPVAVVSVAKERLTRGGDADPEESRDKVFQQRGEGAHWWARDLVSTSPIRFPKNFAAKSARLTVAALDPAVVHRLYAQQRTLSGYNDALQFISAVLTRTPILEALKSEFSMEADVFAVMDKVEALRRGAGTGGAWETPTKRHRLKTQELRMFEFAFAESKASEYSAETTAAVKAIKAACKTDSSRRSNWSLAWTAWAVHRLRQLLAMTYTIGVVGPLRVGKSKFVKRAFGLGAGGGSTEEEQTKHLKAFRVELPPDSADDAGAGAGAAADATSGSGGSVASASAGAAPPSPRRQLTVLDSPGRGDLGAEAQSETFVDTVNVSDVLIVFADIRQSQGTPTLKAIAKAKRANREVSVLVCLNKADEFANALRGDDRAWLGAEAVADELREKVQDMETQLRKFMPESDMRQVEIHPMCTFTTRATKGAEASMAKAADVDGRDMVWDKNHVLNWIAETARKVSPAWGAALARLPRTASWSDGKRRSREEVEKAMAEAEDAMRRAGEEVGGDGDSDGDSDDGGGADGGAAAAAGAAVAAAATEGGVGDAVAAHTHDSGDSEAALL